MADQRRAEIEREQVEELAIYIQPMIEKYLERMPLKDRRMRLRAFKRAIDRVGDKWALFSW